MVPLTRQPTAHGNATDGPIYNRRLSAIARTHGTIYLRRLQLRDENSFDGGYTTAKDYGRENRRQTREMFVPLSHPPDLAQCDFGEALVIIDGMEQKAHCLVIDLPHSNGCFVKNYPAETTEGSWTGTFPPSPTWAECPRVSSTTTSGWRWRRYWAMAIANALAPSPRSSPTSCSRTGSPPRQGQ